MVKQNSSWGIFSIIFFFALVLVIGAYFYFGNSEKADDASVAKDAWVLDSRGIYVKNGNPGTVPEAVSEQQDLIKCVNNNYYEWVKARLVFDSQCLGVCLKKYAVDVVHVPRNKDDDLQSNQCADYRNGVYTHFVEIDKDGNIVRVQ